MIARDLFASAINLDEPSRHAHVLAEFEPIRALSDAGSDRVELEPAVRVSIDQDGRLSALQLQLATDRSWARA